MTPWTIVCQAPLSMGFFRQEYWSGLPFPYPGDLPYPGIKPKSPTLQADSLLTEPPEKPEWKLNEVKKKKVFYLTVACGVAKIKTNLNNMKCYYGCL